MKRWQLKLPGTVANRTRTAILLLVLGAAIVSIIIVAARRRKSIVRPPSVELTAPSEPTPFNTIAFLCRIREDHAQLLTAEDRTVLDAHIHEIESACFSGRESTQVDLATMIGKWSAVARKAAAAC